MQPDDLGDFEAINRYQVWALTKASPETTASTHHMMDAAALGLTGEAGELADIVKKLLYHDHDLTDELRAKAVEELGDAAWYLALWASSLGVALSTVFEQNVDKLNGRYPKGFDPGMSRARYEDQQGSPPTARDWRQEWVRKRQVGQSLIHAAAGKKPDRQEFPYGFAIPQEQRWHGHIEAPDHTAHEVGTAPSGPTEGIPNDVYPLSGADQADEAV